MLVVLLLKFNEFEASDFSLWVNEYGTLYKIPNLTKCFDDS